MTIPQGAVWKSVWLQGGARGGEPGAPMGYGESFFPKTPSGPFGATGGK